MARTAGLSIRDYNDADAEALARIYNAVFPDTPETANEMRLEVTRFDPARYFSRWLVAQRDAEVAGYGFCRHVPWAFHPDRYRLWVAVHPVHQGCGIGRAIMGEIIAGLRARGAVQVSTQTREDFTRGVAFLRSFGFEEHSRDFESRLEVASADLNRFAEYSARAAQLGVEITTLADELARDPHCLPGLYQAYSIMDMAAPRDDEGPPTALPYDEWIKQDITSPRAMPDAYFVAKLGDVYIGLSQLKRSHGDPSLLHQELTGVIAPFQGHGVATALKLRTVEYARQHGYRTIRTFNSSRNEAMLAINRKLGFVPMPAWIGFAKAFA